MWWDQTGTQKSAMPVKDLAVAFSHPQILAPLATLNAQTTAGNLTVWFFVHLTEWCRCVLYTPHVALLDMPINTNDK